MELEKTLTQKKIELLRGEYGPVVIELIKGMFDQTPLIGDNEYATVVNAVRMDTQSGIIQKILDLTHQIKNGDYSSIIKQ